MYAFTFNHPITGTPGLGELNITLQRPGGSWEAATELISVVDQTAYYLPWHNDYVRWHISQKPNLLECAIASFKTDIGGTIPYTRDWDA